MEESPTLPRSQGDASANNEVVRVQQRKRKQGQYHRYDPASCQNCLSTHVKMGISPLLNGSPVQLGFTVSEGTVRNFKHV